MVRISFLSIRVRTGLRVPQRQLDQHTSRMTVSQPEGVGVGINDHANECKFSRLSRNPSQFRATLTSAPMIPRNKATALESGGVESEENCWEAQNPETGLLFWKIFLSWRNYILTYVCTYWKNIPQRGIVKSPKTENAVYKYITSLHQIRVV